MEFESNWCRDQSFACLLFLLFLLFLLLFFYVVVYVVYVDVVVVVVVVVVVLLFVSRDFTSCRPTFSIVCLRCSKQSSLVACNFNPQNGHGIGFRSISFDLHIFNHCSVRCRKYQCIPLTSWKSKDTPMPTPQDIRPY